MTAIVVLPDHAAQTLYDAVNRLTAEVEALRKDRDEAVSVLRSLVECFETETLTVEHASVEWSGPISGEWLEPACGDDHDACSRETCPAIWVVNDAARLAREHRAAPEKDGAK